MSGSTTFSIGELARRSGVKATTIRYYEGIGLVPAPCRSDGRQRRYGEAEVRRLGFIRHSRDLGFSVGAIRELLALSGQPEGSCTDIDEIAKRHVVAIDRRIEQLVALRGVLERMIEECGHGQIGDCRVMQILSDFEHLEHEEHASID